ncbi:MAG: hypothetical protein IPO59_20705, partial [Betaproteobacteria bacterium]|nr:hypothetical protein [Betaproteobacteria bacterium]
MSSPRGDDGVDIDAVDVARDAGVEQLLHHGVVVVQEDVVLATLGHQLADIDLARVVVDRLVLEHRVVDAGDLLQVQAAEILLLCLVAGVALDITRGEPLQVDAMVGAAGVGQVDTAELLEQEGHAFEAVAAMGITAVAEEAQHGLVQLHTPRLLGAVGRHRALGALGRDGARSVGQQQPDQGLEGEALRLDGALAEQGRIG